MTREALSDTETGTTGYNGRNTTKLLLEQEHQG